MRKWIAVALLYAACAATTQQEPKPRWKQNLKVLHPDITRNELDATMRGWTKSLGVECNECHVDLPDGRIDFAADANRDKSIARAMFLMTQRVNAGTIATVTRNKTEVTCYTCHRGKTTPDSEVTKS
jgi:hypothetical protein